MAVNEMIAKLEELGYRITIPRDSKSEQLRELWTDIQKRLRMARDIAEDGGKLSVKHPTWLNENADAARHLRDNAVRAIDIIFEKAVVEREETTDV